MKGFTLFNNKTFAFYLSEFNFVHRNRIWKNMKPNEIRNALYPNCPVRNVLSRVGDKWSMLILFTLESHPTIRFKELQRNIPDISQKILTATLKTLEADGLVKREVFPEVPPRVEYSLTAKGQSLLPLIDNLLTWASDNMEDIIASRKQFYLK